MALIKCKECGKNISSLASICLNCGFPVDPDSAKEMQCGNCKTIIKEDDNYCPGCGCNFMEKEEKYKCINCEAEIKKEHKFCSNCGTYLTIDDKIPVENKNDIKKNIHFFAHFSNFVLAFSIILSIISFIIGITLACGETTTEKAIITFVAYTVAAILITMLGFIFSAPIKWKAYMLKEITEINNKTK